MTQKHNSDTSAGEVRSLYKKALYLLAEEGEISCTLIQRRLGVGYVRARAVFDRMVEEGIIAVHGYKGTPAFDVQAYLKEV